MKIRGIEGLTVGQLSEEVRRGGRFVVFHYAVSVLVLSMKRPSAIYFIRTGESTGARSRWYTVASLLFGWWGFPFGPVFTITAVVHNVRGGKDVTAAVLSALAGAQQPKTYGFPVLLASERPQPVLPLESIPPGADVRTPAA
jgi:hypothetical protein